MDREPSSAERTALIKEPNPSAATRDAVVRATAAASCADVGDRSEGLLTAQRCGMGPNDPPRGRENRPQGEGASKSSSLYGWKVRRNESLVNTDELEFALFVRDDREQVWRHCANLDSRCGS